MSIKVNLVDGSCLNLDRVVYAEKKDSTIEVHLCKPNETITYDGVNCQRISAVINEHCTDVSWTAFMDDGE